MITTIKCPDCGHEFPASEGLSLHLEEATKQAEKNLREKFENEKKSELLDLQKTLDEKDQKLSEYRETELELRKKQRILEEKEKDLELETNRRIDEEKKLIEESTAKRVIAEHHLKVLEKDKKISDMEKLIEDLKRTSQQGSMQTQGEVAELDFENTLRQLFPQDEIREVKKGEAGGDVRQIVKTPLGNECGMILWERKRTKAWDEKWVTKLKEDMARDKAHLAVIITEVLPRDFQKSMGEKRGVWITTTSFVEPLAILLRKNLLDVAKEKAITLNKQTKAEELYDFITGNEFRQQVLRLIDIYTDMQMQISKERVFAEKQWATREMQVKRLISGVGGVVGNIEGISGKEVAEIKELEG